MMTKRKGFVAVLLMTTAFTPMRADAACTPTPDCAELGYTQTLDECPDSAVKCPWDTSKVFCYGGCDSIFQYTCNNEKETAGKYKCAGRYADCGCVGGYSWEDGHCKRLCAIGDIFYVDNTCVAAENYDNTKIVLGIVVQVNAGGVGGQIMAPWPIDENGSKINNNSTPMYWSTEYDDNLNLPNYGTVNTAIKDYDSCENTSKIVAKGNASRYPAAWATRKYAPTAETKGKWCLPAAGIMNNIFNNQSSIQNAILKVGGISFSSGYMWSSTEASKDNVWRLEYNTGVDSVDKVTGGKNVYPVLAF